MTTSTTPEHLIDWSAYGVNVALILESCMISIADDVAYAHDWVSDTIDCDGDVLPITSDEDVIRALRQPYPLATVFTRLCRGAGVPVPEAVQQAMQDCEPMPKPAYS